MEKWAEVDEDGDQQVTWAEHLKSTFDYLPEEIEDFDKDDNPEVRSLHDVSFVLYPFHYCHWIPTPVLLPMDLS